MKGRDPRRGERSGREERREEKKEKMKRIRKIHSSKVDKGESIDIMLIYA